MVKRQLFCDVCACVTDHMIDGDDEDDSGGGELALCLRCGRLHSVPRDEAQPSPPPASRAPCRHR